MNKKVLLRKRKPTPKEPDQAKWQGKGRVPMPPRDTAIRLYANWLRKPERIEQYVDQAISESNWEGRDRALFYEIMYGVIRQHGRLKWEIGKLSSKGASSNYYAYAATAIGLYQLLFMDRIPQHAATDTSVSVARRHAGPELAGWCNAILRGACRSLEEIRATVPHEDFKPRRLANICSHPLWLVEKWKETFNETELLQLLEWNNRRPDVHLRVNLNLTTPEEIVNILERKRISTRRSLFDPVFIHIRQTGFLEELDILRSGKITIQDISQGQVAKIVDPKAGEKILDLCAAPGGKTLHLAELCPECKIIATDSSAERLKFVEKSVRRRKLENVTVIPYDDALESKDKFDAILVDVPCSGTGVLARRPDLRWRLKVPEIRRLASVQLQLLRYASERVKHGGRIVYSTCSLEKEENESVVERFLDESGKFECVNIKDYILLKFQKEDSVSLKLRGPEIEGDAVFSVRLERIK